jgi:hypothetical protein
MENKKLVIFDGDSKKMVKDDAIIKGTSIILKETGTGKPIFKGSNKVIISGSEFNAIKDFDYDNFACEDTNDFLPNIPTYDYAFSEAGKPMRFKPGTNTPIGIANIAASNDLGFYTGASGSPLEDVVSALTFSNEKHQKVYQYFTRRVCLWCLGIDGCGVEASRVFKVLNTKWIAPYGDYQHYNDGTGGNNTYNSIETAMVPFKYRTSDADLDDTYRAQYFGRTEVNSAVAYFFKTFDEAPTLIRRYADDSTFLSNVEDVWADTRAAEAEAVVQLKMSVSATDCREYFQKRSGVNDSKVNSISLCTAVPYVRDTNKIEYLDIRPFTRFNFPNEALIDTSKGIDITYYLYY